MKRKEVQKKSEKENKNNTKNPQTIFAMVRFGNVMGSSGSGKSTIAHLISRFYLPSQGSILIDSTNIHDISKSLLRQNIALVPQESLLFRGSILENCKIGNPSASIDEVIEALKIANDTLYGLGAAVWTRNGNIAYRMGRAIQAGIVWTNCYHAYPAHSPFGGYKQSGVGRETHKMMLNHYRQNKNLHCLLYTSPSPRD